MNNSPESGIGKSIRRSVSILLIFAALAVTHVAKAADLNSTQSNETPNLTFPIPDHSAAASNASQPNAESSRLQTSLHLSAEQRGLFCYTDFGVYPMRTWARPGDSCYIQVGFTTVWGVVGF
jgi:hypothetical protein